MGNDEEVLPVLTGIVGWRVVTIGVKSSIYAGVVGRALVVVVTIFWVVVAMIKSTT